MRAASPPGGTPPDAPFTVTTDTALPVQGYRLRAGPGFAETGYQVNDHPDSTVRGFQLDVSRDRVPTRRTRAAGWTCSRSPASSSSSCT
ncbi:hypothetical protein ACWGRF_33165 [Streptomyces zhihengii]